jgi:hypothetical protein
LPDLLARVVVRTIVFVVAIPMTNVGKPAVSASATDCTAAVASEAFVSPMAGQFGAPSVASRMYFGFVLVSVRR